VKILAEYPRQLARQAEARVSQLEQTGALSIDAVSSMQAEGTLPHYKRFKKDIDAEMAKFPANVRMLPTARQYAYNLVVGQHADELIAEKVEETKRSQRDDPANASRPGESGRPQGGGRPATEPVDVAKVFGEDAAVALTSIGKDFETMVKRMGYKSVDEYVALAKEQGVVNG